MRRRVLTILWVMLPWSAAALAVAGDETERVAVVWPGGEATLLPEQASVMAKRAVALFSNCSLESRSDPNVFQGRSPEAEWAAAVQAPRVHVTWPDGVSIERNSADVRHGAKPDSLRRSGSMRLNEAVIPLDVRAPYWFSRQGQSIVIWTKCRWPDTAAVLCDPLVSPHLDAGGRRQCASPEAGAAAF